MPGAIVAKAPKKKFDGSGGVFGKQDKRTKVQHDYLCSFMRARKSVKAFEACKRQRVSATAIVGLGHGGDLDCKQDIINPCVPVTPTYVRMSVRLAVLIDMLMSVVSVAMSS